MVWFKVDDSLPFHPKAMAVSLAALGLWTVAGAWSGHHLTDGFIPDHMLMTLSRGQSELAKELCAAGLWKRSKGGYQFHQWHADDDGTVRNPSKKDVVATRNKRAEAGRKGGLASGKSRSKPASEAEANASAGASAGASRIVEPPSRPVPSRRDGALSADVEGDQSVRAQAREREAVRHLSRTYGLTDEESRTVWAEAERRASVEIKYPVKYLNRMSDEGHLADVVEAVQQASEPPPEPGPTPLRSVPSPPYQPPPPPRELTEEERQAQYEERERLLAPIRARVRKTGDSA